MPTIEVKPEVHKAITDLKLDISAEIREDITMGEVIRRLIDDSHRLGNVEDMILAAIESFSEAEADGMTSLPIGDVLGFLGELKAEIEGDGEDEPTG
ncbi:MAG: hypothetical protein WC455_28085 [Dehalococcoidia bacterium]|jgi:hypothetical protein